MRMQACRARTDGNECGENPNERLSQVVFSFRFFGKTCEPLCTWQECLPLTPVPIGQA